MQEFNLGPGQNILGVFRTNNSATLLRRSPQVPPHHSLRAAALLKYLAHGTVMPPAIESVDSARGVLHVDVGRRLSMRG
jgi:hypothetical protein